MSNYSTNGIIINIRNFLESDKIVTLFTEEKGIIESVAKGARKSTSRKSSSLELLNYGKFHFAKGKNLDIMLEVKLLDNILKEVPPELCNFIFYFAELINKVFEKGFEDIQVFSEVLALRNCIVDKKEIVILKLQLFILREQGVLPNLSKCLKCGNSLEKERYFLYNNAGYFCSDHRQGGQKVSDRALKIQLFLDREKVEKCTKLNINIEDFALISLIQNNWLEESLERKINSYKFLF